ncbi:universal stress protein [Kitasatospora sp. NPDC058162]|uniref:universal stress protein n=1 Tax=Kitasatospora sp. NPDC058162 TaxID=3346362 RepID=UPI0036DDA61F
MHVAREGGLSGADSELLDWQRELVESLGRTPHRVLGEDVPRTLLRFARERDATQLVLGASRRGRLNRFLAGPGPGIGETTVDLSGDIDVHMVTHESAAGGHHHGDGPQGSR